MALRIILFLVINFVGLGLGGFFTGTGIRSNWYANLNVAPWTPPGWVFGAAWTTIMICFAIYMAYAYQNSSNKGLLIGLFALQWLLNFAWNPVFFKYQAVLIALIIITALTVLVGYFLFIGFAQMKSKGLLVLPYFIRFQV
ncbi:MAG: tryptophan-rich sensory protein [Crocinitomix sp.]|nr:tryptophan-rich sensory protein [Crocinitomix sp.]